ncbi:hypothetical protein PGB90_004890 [Kerria lacca]
MEYTTETVEVEEICDDANPAKKFKKIVKGYDQKFVTDWKNDPNYKSWVEKTKKEEDETPIVTTYHFEAGETTECIELGTDDQKHQIEIKTIQKPNVVNTTTPIKNTRSGKRQIKVMDPNLPAFVCTEHNENISLDCRYCRIASGFKKKNSQKHVQNDEISSSGKVTVAIPKRDINSIGVQLKTGNDGLIGANNDIYSINSQNEVSGNLSSQKNSSVGKYVQKFRSEWLKLPEFKDWLVECKMSEYGDMSQAQCKFCGTLLVNNSNNLVRHAISKKHTKNMELEILDFDSTQGQGSPQTQKSMNDVKSKEEIFGSYVASELKRIKNKKTYEEVKWKILQTLQAAAEKEADDQDNPMS